MTIATPFCDRDGRRFLRVLLALAVATSLLAGGQTPSRSPARPSLRAVVVQAVDSLAARLSVERHGGRVVADLPIVDGVAALVPASRLAGVVAAPGVRSVTDNEPVHVQGSPSPLHEPSAVYPKAIRADKLWSAGIVGSGVTVAVIDTGIASVPDLQGRLVGGVDLSGEGDPFTDSFGHGTFVAGVVAGSGSSSAGAYKGVAPGANLVSIKIAGRNGASDVAHVLAAIQWAVSFKTTYGIKVLNLSLGTDSTQSYWRSPLNFAVERAWDSGIVVVVSASNRGPGAGTVTKPGDDPLVVTVGAIDDVATVGRGDDVMAGFSGEGPTAADGLTKPDLVAPGRSLVSLRAPGSAIDEAYPGSRVGSAYFKGSGTSFSAAATSGAAALLLAQDPRLSPNDVKGRMMASAAPGPVGNPNIDGRGSLDVHAASVSRAGPANQFVPRSLGIGSLAADRGSLAVQAAAADGATLLSGSTGDLTAQDKLFDQAAYLATEWTGSSWYGSSWYGSSWYGSSWYGSSWYGSSWYGSSWYGSSWYGGWE